MNDTTHTYNLRKGDKAAFKKLFEKYYHSLKGFSRNFISCEASCEDIVQNTFVSMWEDRKKINHPEAVKSYLYASVRNACLNYVTRQKKTLSSDVLENIRSDQFCEQQIILEEVNSRIHSAIKDLPPQAKKIVLLSMQGAKNIEIANNLNISVNTVKTIKKSAYHKLRVKLRGVDLFILALYLL